MKGGAARLLDILRVRLGSPFQIILCRPQPAPSRQGRQIAQKGPVVPATRRTLPRARKISNRRRPSRSQDYARVASLPVALLPQGLFFRQQSQGLSESGYEGETRCQSIQFRDKL
jgi:hypothetical protein